MSSPPQPGPGGSTPPRLFFDGFALRLDSGELFRDGAPVKLQPQPAKILEILASRSGEVVGREEIRQLVWGDSFLDFDANLNFCIKQIRQALGDSANEPRYIETVPRRGYRFLQPVQMETAPEPAQSTLPEPRRWPWLAGLSVAGMAAVLLILLVGSRLLPPQPNPRLVVLPLACRSRNPADQQVCGGITEALTAELTQQFPRDLDVIAPVSALTWGRIGKSREEIGRKLKADYFLSGEAAPSDRQLRIAAWLERAADGEVIWKDDRRVNLGDAPLIYRQIVREVARKLGLPPPAAGPERTVKPSDAVYEAYLRGLYFLRQEEYDKATASLQEAVLVDPDFAPAYARIALAWLAQELPPWQGQGLEVIEAAARRALKLDPQLAEAHLALGYILFQYRLDWERAGQEYRHALALNPGSADAYHAYALYLAALGLHKEAIAANARARELDPASMLVGSDHAWFLYAAGRYDEAVREARKTWELFPTVQGAFPGVARHLRGWTLWVLLHSAWKAGDEQTALGAGREIMELAGEGKAAAQIRSLQDFVNWHSSWLARRAQPAGPYFLATAAVESGDYDRALDIMEKDCQTRPSFVLLYAAVEPAFEPLRADPRFPASSAAPSCRRTPRRGERSGPGPMLVEGAIPLPAAAPTTPGPGSAASGRAGTCAPSRPCPRG
jgi:DNA-binding winged helix-turn-helix (wHTH) protein/tetratricopeptide (TPR) repeat protein